MDLKNKKNIDIKIGTVFQKVRKSLGLTQEQVAEEINLASRYISDIERNKVKGSIDTLIGLCNVYNVTPTFILKDYITATEEQTIPAELIGFLELSSHDKKIIADLIKIMNSKE